jgi:Dna[CI] antecedent, DciA
LTRTFQAVSVQDATQSDPTLLRLLELARESTSMLEQVRSLIPPTLHTSVQAGAWDRVGNWCLLVQGNACAAKLRQITPQLVQALNQRGWKVTSIRLKIQASARGA